jgi:hypothetical protein
VRLRPRYGRDRECRADRDCHCGDGDSRRLRAVAGARAASCTSDRFRDDEPFGNTGVPGDVRCRVGPLQILGSLRLSGRPVQLRATNRLSWRRENAAAAADAATTTAARLAVRANAARCTAGRLPGCAADRNDMHCRRPALRLCRGLLRRNDCYLHERPLAIHTVAATAVIHHRANRRRSATRRHSLFRHPATHPITTDHGVSVMSHCRTS